MSSILPSQSIPIRTSLALVGEALDGGRSESVGAKVFAGFDRVGGIVVIAGSIMREISFSEFCAYSKGLKKIILRDSTPLRQMMVSIALDVGRRCRTIQSLTVGHGG